MLSISHKPLKAHDTTSIYTVNAATAATMVSPSPRLGHRQSADGEATRLYFQAGGIQRHRFEYLLFVDFLRIGASHLYIAVHLVESSNACGIGQSTQATMQYSILYRLSCRVGYIPAMKIDAGTNFNNVTFSSHAFSL
jgi:hypothetical protein